MSAENSKDKLFSRGKFKFHQLGDSLLDISAGSGRLWIAATGRQLLWHDSNCYDELAQSKQIPTVDEVVRELPSPHHGDEISRLFASPNGLACMVTTVSMNCFLCFTTGISSVQGRSVRPTFTIKPIASLQRKHITCTAWDPFTASNTIAKNKHNTSGAVLVGTDQGEIIELLFSYTDGASHMSRVLNQQQQQVSTVELCSEVVYKLPGPCSGLYFSKTSNTSNIADAQHCVVATTSSGSLYQFLGVCGTSHGTGQFPNITTMLSGSTSIFQPLFRGYPEAPMLSCIEMPPANLPGTSTNISVYQQKESSPTNFSWLTSSGIYVAQFNFATTNIDTRIVLSKQKLIYFPKFIRGPSAGSRVTFGNAGPIIGMGLGQFHVLVVFEKSALMYNILSEQLVEDDKMEDMYEPVLGTAQDPITHVTWIWTKNYIYYYRFENEDRDIWRYFLQIGDFEKARKLCGNDKTKLNHVLMETAKTLYDSKEYAKSAQYFAESLAPIEGVVPDLMALSDREPLRIYLLRRLEILIQKGEQPSSISVVTLILWLIDVFLGMVNNSNANKETKSGNSKPLLNEFRGFLSRREILEALTQLGSRRYELFISHGDWDNAIFLAELIRDWTTVCNFYISKKQYKEVTFYKSLFTISLWFAFTFRPLLYWKNI